jgi:hypothetical protein
MPNTSPFYPSVSNLVSASDFPAQLQFLQNGLQTVLSNMFYKDLQFKRSPDGSQAYYNITLVTGEVLKIDLFDSGFSVVINPGSSQETILELSLNYNCPILGIIKNFRLDGFSYQTSDIKKILDIIICLGVHGYIKTSNIYILST